MPINRNSRLWWFLVPLALLLSVSAAIWIRTATPPRVDLDFSTLTDVHGMPGKPADYAGHYLLVSFGYTSCPDVCPLTLAAIHTALRDLGSNAPALIPIFITVDPQRDHPARLADYLGAFDPRIHGFTGSPRAIAASAAAFHVEFQAQPLDAAGAYSVDHTAVLFLVDPERRMVAQIPESLPARDLTRQIVETFSKARAQQK